MKKEDAKIGEIYSYITYENSVKIKCLMVYLGYGDNTKFSSIYFVGCWSANWWLRIDQGRVCWTNDWSKFEEVID